MHVLDGEVGQTPHGTWLRARRRLLSGSSLLGRFLQCSGVQVLQEGSCMCSVERWGQTHMEPGCARGGGCDLDLDCWGGSCSALVSK